MDLKTLRRTHPAVRDDIADLITRRPLPAPDLPALNPFLFLNHHGPQTFRPGNGGLPFGPHPHRGFETVTFILDGELAHRDSAGHDSVIRAGGVQWMTAGRGVVHAELSPDSFKAEGGPLEILQLWVNLPARLKMTEPAYTGLQREDIPVLERADGRATVRLVSGRWEGRAGPVSSLTDVFLAVVTLRPGGVLAVPGLAGRVVLLYVVRGAARLGDEMVPAFHLAELSGDGDNMVLSANDREAVILLGHAAPLDEPIVAHGPFVMNTHEEIVQAVRDYQSGRLR